MTTKIHQTTQVLTKLLIKTQQKLPDSWNLAVGILRKKKKPVAALQYQKKLRSEWEKRLKKLSKYNASR